MNMIDKVLSLPEFKEHPPILVDIGASGELHTIWKTIAKYSICIAFDADSRDIEYTKNESGHYKKLYLYNRILTSQLKDNEETFYLTKSPYCSSLLQPLNKKLTNWAFADLFEVEKKVFLKTIDLTTVLTKLKLNRVDWFKTDSQGTDLRLFESLGEQIINKILVAEFEPGIIDAYQDEDKLWQLISYMDKQNFWMSDIMIKGSQRIKADIKDSLNWFEKRFISQFIKTSPGWGEVAYINSFKQDYSQRDFLLGWVFSTLKQQHGFALQLAIEGYKKFNVPIFLKLKKNTLISIKTSYHKLPFFFLKAFFRKAFKRIMLCI